ncbi:MAG: ParB/RepB/Spo0J family partition protein [Sulfuricaulis sp.]
MSLEKKGSERLSAIREGLSKPRRALPSSDGPSTAIGIMISEANGSLRQRLDQAQAEAAQKSQELEKLRALQPLQFLDPRQVQRSPFADRHAKAYEDKDFDELCDLIKETGGNTEPGQVRQVQAFDPAAPRYEIASGHRRHAACLKLGLPFKAIVRDMDDATLIQQMYAENTGRRDLSPFERGRHYALLLKQKKFATARELAAKLGVHPPRLVDLLKFDELAEPIIEAFADPREIRAHWVTPLVQAWKRDSAKVRAAAKEISGSGSRPLAVFQKLASVETPKKVIASDSQILGRIRTVNGCPAVVLFKDAPQQLVEQISALVVQWSKDNHT